MTNKVKFSTNLDDIFDHLHNNPELSWEEIETTHYIKSFLESYGCKVQTFEDCTGVVADIGQGSPVVGLRADMDALWQEVNGGFRPNHSCGHDAHMTIVLGVFLDLIKDRDKLQGTVRFIFQPAEEKGTGALKMIEHGVVDDVDYLYGMHLRPVQELSDGEFAPGISHGAASFVKGVIQGEDAHGARPHLNTNAIQVGAELVQAINSMNFDPLVPHSMKVTSFHSGGENTNIIPGNATFTIDIRAQNNDLMEEMMEQLEKTIHFLSERHTIFLNTELEASMKAAMINEDAQSIIEDAICETLGKQTLRPVMTTTGGDDFHFYTIKRPQLKASMLAIGCNLKPGLHHPQMTFNHGMIPEAVKVLTRVINKTLVAEV
ncbi:M20 peptidase aminoacylase family protein [Salipaludibacillus keqinensis]